MIFSKLVTQLKLWGFGFSEFFLIGIESGQRLEIDRAGVIVTLVNGALELLFPAIEGMPTIGAPEFGFGFSERFMELEKMTANFTTDLLTKFAIVVVKKFIWGLTVGAASTFGDFLLRTAMLHRVERMTVIFLKGCEQVLPMFGWLWGRLKLQWPEWVYVEVPVVRMFFLKSSLGLTSGLRFANTSWSSLTMRSICSRSNFEQIQITKREIRSIIFSKIIRYSNIGGGEKIGK